MDHNSSLVQDYDFKSKAGITAILVALRKSEISSKEKNELRDLVFLYTSGGGDESVRISLEQKLKLHNIRPVVAEVVVPPQVLPFGTLRPVPTFNALEVKVSTPKPISLEKKIVNKADTPFASVSVAETVSIVKEDLSASQPTKIVATAVTENKVVEVKPSPAPVVSQPNPVKTLPVNEIAKTISTPSVEEVIQATVKTEVKIPEVAPAPVRPVIPMINTKYLDRIREIKADVNTKVGNPVNLVDIDNQVGREYMNALLEAMKRLNGGVAGELDKAMQRLETAYSAVESIVSARSVQAVKDTSVVEEVPKVVPDLVVKEVKKVIPPPEPEIINKPIPSIVEVVASEESVVAPKVVADVSIMPPAPAPVANAVPEMPVISSLAEQLSNNDKKVAKTFINSETNPNPPIPSPYVSNSSVGEKVSAVPLKSTSVPLNKIENKVSSLAEERKMPTFNDVPSVLPTNANEITNPLYTSEIDAGLDQLLSDWSLFKKSGLFGTGPKGREHPLFKKISGLQIPLLLAGRFEGANQEIRQSITDYMNGWRYEQGIIYEQGETFELYLRRVIRHIIDLQKRKTAT